MFWMQPIAVPENNTYTIPKGHIVFYPNPTFPIEGTLYIQEGATLVLAGTLSVATSGNVINEGTLIENALDGAGSHDHDERYYTKNGTDVAIDDKLAFFDNRLANDYYTKTVTDTLLSGKAATTHTHSGVAPSDHDHDDRYKRAVVGESETAYSAGLHVIAYNLHSNTRVSGLFHVRITIPGSHWSYLVWASSHYNANSAADIKVFAAKGFGANPADSFYLRKRAATSGGYDYTYGDTLFLIKTNLTSYIKVELLTNSNIEDITQWILVPNLSFPDTSGFVTMKSVTATAPDYAALSHNHDGTYAALSHNHDGTYAPASHTHNYAPASHTHNYAPASHTHNYAPASHTHNYAPASHTHQMDEIEWDYYDSDFQEELAYLTGVKTWTKCPLQTTSVKYNGSQIDGGGVYEDLMVVQSNLDYTRAVGDGSKSKITYILGLIELFNDYRAPNWLWTPDIGHLLHIASIPNYDGWSVPKKQFINVIGWREVNGTYEVGNTILLLRPDKNIYLYHGFYELLSFNTYYYD